MMQSITYWKAAERPRERLLTSGAGALSDTELLAVILRNGVRGQDVISLSQDLLKRFGGLRNLGAATPAELKEVKGLGPAKITSLIAMGEITRRQLREKALSSDVVRDPDSVIQYLQHSLRDRKVEIFKVLFLNKANRIVGESDISTGTIDEAHVHPREILKKILEFHATAVILVHNHPSGRTEPSREDVELTRRIQSLCQTINVRVLDHLIIGSDGYSSFRQQGFLD